MDLGELFHGPNAGAALELYERYRQDPASVDARSAALFAALERQAGPLDFAAEPAAAQTVSATDVQEVVLAARLARNIRQFGHLRAKLDPFADDPPTDHGLEPAAYSLREEQLRRLPGSIVFPEQGAAAGSFADAVARLRAVYMGYIGFDVSHVHIAEERDWLQHAAEGGSYLHVAPERQRETLQRLVAVEEFEQFLHRTFQGQKRFSIEGTDMLVPMLDEIIDSAVRSGTREVTIGMAHRGRLSVLAHVLGKPFGQIFTEFHAGPAEEADVHVGWTGDVKYHLGSRRTIQEPDGPVQLTLANNPSHLEFVNPVVQGLTRAAQDNREHAGPALQEVARALNVTVHGDAAFPGEGVVAETLNLSRLRGYTTGGTIHIIANNQVGFTTDPQDDRSTRYASDLAKGFEIPVLHVNADQPEACLAAARIAIAYRQLFHKDVLIDLVGYRRFGHNEGDEPSFTQPLLYEKVHSHPTVATLYSQQLEAQGIVTEVQAEEMRKAAQTELRQAFDDVVSGKQKFPHALPAEKGTIEEPAPPGEDRLRALNDALLARPGGLQANTKLERLLQRRRELLEKPQSIDWAHAEALAFAAILEDGTPIRMSGQDTQRGTFSQRHLVLHDTATGRTYVPHDHLPQARASFDVYNSPLSETAAMGFEYGYSLRAPEAFVLWEAQFGDFANAGQVIVDQFISAARAKWSETSGLTLLLPHGYEGQGPEHSSGRVERYLQLAAEENLRIANCTTSSQYFHLLRLQASALKERPRPLIVMTPKSLLRHPLAASSLADLAQGRFQPVLDDEEATARKEKVERIVFCSGKISVEYRAAAKENRDAERGALLRVELLYPFPEAEIRRILATYPSAREFAWLQEEPRNMGAYAYIAARLQALLPGGAELQYIGRSERAATAEGMPDVHQAEHERILVEALSGKMPLKLETRGGKRRAK
ncbi:MAG: 2-oxoglutarate dehydrogenase E1 component [Thermaerobacter sp.]|nr:2-oxoglutarate dehydrogenase E1 component [Thermaerobacter sp.]